VTISALHRIHPQYAGGDVQHCDNNQTEANDREARYALQYGHERQAIRATEHAYMMTTTHDDDP
jgi:hypothetical protein